MDTTETKNPFPDATCQQIISELSVWTSVEDCLAAARYLENRPLTEDSFTNTLIVPYLDNQEFEIVLVHCLKLFIPEFRIPTTKIRLAALVDSEISSNTCDALSKLQFLPNIDCGAAGHIDQLFPNLSGHHEDRFLLIKDDPAVIEVIQNPLRCLIDIMSRVWPTAYKMRLVREESMRETGAAPTIFQQPYTDGPLCALIEALVFYVNDLDLGPIYASKHTGVNMGYRSTEIISAPPINSKLLQAAKDTQKIMFESLHE